jgi:hypothetical protein
VKNASNPLAGKLLSFGGVYGTIDDPEKAVDALLAYMKSSATKDGTKVSFQGSPQQYKPASLDGAILKCQGATIDNSKNASSGMAKQMKVTYCVWGDHSTLGMVMPATVVDIAAGKATAPEEAADTTAKLRKEVRVKA